MGKQRPLFDLLDHCCRVCGGRLLAAPDPATGGHLVRCAECSQRGTIDVKGPRFYEFMCWCGIKLANGKDAGLRCRRVEAPTPERPQEVVVHQSSEQPSKPSPPSGRRPVRYGSDD